MAAALAVATISPSAVGTSVAAASPSIGGFSVRPAESNPKNPATRAYFIRPVQAGSAFSDRVVVSNNGPTALELLVYPVDGLTGATSGVVYANHSDPIRRAGAWIHFRTSTIDVPAHGRALVPFTAIIPGGAAPGDHLAGLAFEAAHPAKTSGRFSVTEVFRTIVGVEMVVAGNAEPRLALNTAKLAPLPGTNYPAVVINVRNAGGDLCKPRLTVGLAGVGHARSVSHQLDTILPRESIPFPFPWPVALKSGSYRTSIVGSGCGPTVKLTTTTHLGSPLKRSHASIVSSAPAAAPAHSSSWWIFLLVGGAGIGIGAVLARRGRRARSA